MSGVYWLSMEKRVVKRSGAVVPFERDILERSLRRAGASREVAKRIAADVEDQISGGDSTTVIYSKAFAMLHDRARDAASRYSLKRALFDLGPTGFPFEKFVAELFRRSGYAATTNAHLRGACISHEVDVLTTSPERIAMEVKFHNDMRIRSDVKAVLYVKARFDDLTGRTGKILPIRRGAADRCIFVTNTKFTRNAIEYADCAGVDLLGWGYPYRNNLQTYIRRTNSHPITCLSSLSKATVRELFSAGIVTCRGLLERDRVLRGLPDVDSVLAEAEMLCSSPAR